MTNVMDNATINSYANELLEQISQVDTDLELKTAEREHLIAEAVKQIDSETGLTDSIDDLTSTRDHLVTRLCELVATNQEQIFPPGSKKAVFRSGEIYVRAAPERLVVDDEEAAIESLRKLHMLRRFTRTIIKLVPTELKKHKDVVARMNGVSLEQNEFITIKPHKREHGIKRPWHPLRRSVKS